MTTQIEAMKLALEALQSSQQYVEACANAKTKAGWGEQLDVAEDAITALREALAEQPAQQEPVALPCCGYTDASAVKWNSYNQVVQCHNCGQVYSTPQPPAQPQEFKGVLPFGSTPTEPGLWLSFNDGRIYVWQETGWIESANGITKGNT